MSIHMANALPSSNGVDLDHETFAAAVEAGDIVVVDVREPHEFKAGHIPGSVNLPLSRFSPGDLPAPSERVAVIVCQAGVRSRKALNQAVAAGRTDLMHYPGGMAEWRGRGRTVAV
jgi:rhodanese-related sulfurtransferase